MSADHPIQPTTSRSRSILQGTLAAALCGCLPPAYFLTLLLTVGIEQDGPLFPTVVLAAWAPFLAGGGLLCAGFFLSIPGRTRTLGLTLLAAGFAHLSVVFGLSRLVFAFFGPHR